MTGLLLPDSSANSPPAIAVGCTARKKKTVWTGEVEVCFHSNIVVHRSESLQWGSLCSLSPHLHLLPPPHPPPLSPSKLWCQWRMPAPVPPSPDPPSFRWARCPSAATAWATSAARQLWVAGGQCTLRPPPPTCPLSDAFSPGGWTCAHITSINSSSHFAPPPALWC